MLADPLASSLMYLALGLKREKAKLGSGSSPASTTRLVLLRDEANKHRVFEVIPLPTHLPVA